MQVSVSFFPGAASRVHEIIRLTRKPRRGWVCSCSTWLPKRRQNPVAAATWRDTLRRSLPVSTVCGGNLKCTVPLSGMTHVSYAYLVP